MTVHAHNPLLADAALPLFDQILPHHVKPAMDFLLQQADAALEQVTQAAFAPDWMAISQTLGVQTERLERAWGIVSHLNSVRDTPELRAAFNDALPSVTAFWTRLGADERLYAKYKQLRPDTLNLEQQQALHNALRAFVLGGAELQGDAKKRFAEIQERQAELAQKFSENTLDATESFLYLAALDELDGLPADVLQAAHAAAQAEGLDGYKLSLKFPCYQPVMQFAKNRDLRRRLYSAYVTRASDQAPVDAQRFDNTALIREILALRREEAQLLGYSNYAEVSLAPKMADSPQQVMQFLRDLAARARPYAQQDVADLRDFARQQLGISDPQPWDWLFISEQLKEARYAFSEQEIKPYFTAPQVIKGLFKIVERLFEVLIVSDAAPVWHPLVQFFRIERDGVTVGQFYLDPAARTGKRGGAWMDHVRARWLRPDTAQLQTPVAHLVCNFAEGLDGKPPLLTHDDVITLFHEFGHGLHHLLTQVNERDVSGISGVEWDAVELPSQFMENFCWEWQVLQHLTAHVDSGEALPRGLFDKMIAAKNFQTGLQTVRQIEFALLDMRLHTDHDPALDFLPVMEQVRNEVAVLHPPAWSRSAHTFGHIFSGGYAAGYYSYKWAEVLSADAYAAFEESASPQGEAQVETGRRYRKAILETGGSRPAMASFKAFRGRDPRIDALLRHQGMATALTAGTTATAGA
jgi:oligopeptidase A